MVDVLFGFRAKHAREQRAQGCVSFKGLICCVGLMVDGVERKKEVGN